MVLSLQDGLFAFYIDYAKTPEISKNAFGDTVALGEEQEAHWYYPHHTIGKKSYKCIPCIIKPNDTDKYIHVMRFLHGINYILDMQTEYVFDIAKYLDDGAFELREYDT